MKNNPDLLLSEVVKEVQKGITLGFNVVMFMDQYWFQGTSNVFLLDVKL